MNGNGKGKDSPQISQMTQMRRNGNNGNGIRRFRR